MSRYIVAFADSMKEYSSIDAAIPAARMFSEDQGREMWVYEIVPVRRFVPQAKPVPPPPPMPKKVV